MRGIQLWSAGSTVPRVTHLDHIGLGAVAGLLVWLLAITLRQGYHPAAMWPYLVTCLFLILGVAAGQQMSRLSVAALDLLLWGCPLVLLFSFPLNPDPGKWPTGYANANAALGVQLCALFGVRIAQSNGWRRWVHVAAAVLAYGLTWLNDSIIGETVGAVVLALALLPWVSRVVGRFSVVLGGLAITAGCAVLLGIASRMPWAAYPRGIFDEVRLSLWRLGYKVWRDSPVIGHGAGSFADANPLAVDPDTAMAHSGLLQVAAEGGAVGVGLLALLVGAGLLQAGRARGSAAAMAALGWTALCVHSLFDHVHDFPAVPFAAGFLLGFAAQNSSMSPRVKVQADAAGGDEASGRAVNKGP